MDSTERPVTLVKTVADVGVLVRARRRAAGLTQAQAAGLAGVGNRFFSELERGKPTIEFGRALQVLERLGFEVAVAHRSARAFDSTRGAPSRNSPEAHDTSKQHVDRPGAGTVAGLTRPRTGGADRVVMHASGRQAGRPAKKKAARGPRG
ncbi:MAG: helix-turn-helix domain-containing protein [Deltaproteobacteria bacterium]